MTKRYQGGDYFFEVGQPIYWDNSDMIKSCFHSMHSAMWDIINSPQVRGISYVPILYPKLKAHFPPTLYLLETPTAA